MRVRVLVVLVVIVLVVDVRAANAVVGTMRVVVVVMAHIVVVVMTHVVVVVVLEVSLLLVDNDLFFGVVLIVVVESAVRLLRQIDVKEESRCTKKADLLRCKHSSAVGVVDFVLRQLPMDEIIDDVLVANHGQVVFAVVSMADIFYFFYFFLKKNTHRFF